MDLDKTSEARRKAQRNGEEDPVVVAQRFLNIYRQIHIFNAEKKAAFNKMLLALSPQIRGMFGQLPGGAMLQDYVDELAEKEGIEKSTINQTTDIADEDVKQAKILATALAEAQVQASAKLQGMTPASTTSAQAQASAPANASVGTAKLAMDKNFAQEFATVLSSAMQKNSAAHETEIKTIIATLGKTQLEIIKVLQEENTEHREEMKNISQMMLQAQAQISAAAGVAQTQVQPTTKVSEETKQLIKILLNSQQQILERIAKVETLAANNNSSQTAAPLKVVGEDIALIIEKSEKNVSQMITAFQERQKSDTLEIAKLINESQQNLVQMMVQHNNLNQNNSTAANNNANNIQINTTDYSAVLSRIADQLANLQIASSGEEQAQKGKNKKIQPAETNIQINFPEKALTKLIEAQSKTYQKIAEQQTKELSAAISLALKEGQKASTQNIIEALNANPIVIKQTEAPAYTPPPIPQSDYNFMQTEDEVPHTQPVNLFDDADSSELSDLQETPSGFDFGNDNSSDTHQETFVESSLEAQEDFSSEGMVVSDVLSEQVTASDETSEDAPVVLSEMPKKKKKKKKKKEALLNEEPEIIKSERQEASQDSLAAEMPILSEISDTPPIVENDIDDSPIDEVSLAPEQKQSDIPEPEEAFEDLPEEKNDTNSWLESFDALPEDTPSYEPEEDIEPAQLDTPDDWGFTSAPEKKSEPLEAAQDWEWVYEEEPSSQNEDNSGEGIDWEWDYVPEDSAEATTFHNNNLQPLAENCSIYSGDLFFQEHIFSSQTIANSQPLPILKHYPGIFDSTSVDETNDPYKNSSLKD